MMAASVALAELVPALIGAASGIVLALGMKVGMS